LIPWGLRPPFLKNNPQEIFVAQETNFDMGRFEEAIDTLKKGQADIREEQSGMREDLTEIKLAFAEAKGGWRIMLMLGTGVATFVGFIVSYLPDFLGRAK
jgi:hypothetical protein